MGISRGGHAPAAGSSVARKAVIRQEKQDGIKESAAAGIGY